MTKETGLLLWWMALIVMGSGILGYLFGQNIKELRAARLVDGDHNLRRVAVTSLMNTLSLLVMFVVFLVFAVAAVVDRTPVDPDERLVRSFLLSLAFLGVILSRFCEARVRQIVRR